MVRTSQRPQSNPDNEKEHMEFCAHCQQCSERSNWTFIGEFFARVQAADTRAHAAEAREQQALAANRSLKFHLEQAMHKIHRYEKREIDGGRQQVIEYQMQMGKIRPINTSPPCVSSAVDRAPEEHQTVVESTETDAEVALENGGDRDTA